MCLKVKKWYKIQLRRAWRGELKEFPAWRNIQWKIQVLHRTKNLTAQGWGVNKTRLRRGLIEREVAERRVKTTDSWIHTYIHVFQKIWYSFTSDYWHALSACSARFCAKIFTCTAHLILPKFRFIHLSTQQMFIESQHPLQEMVINTIRKHENSDTMLNGERHKI